MKSCSSDLNTHIQGEVTSLATLWKITRKDGTVLGFTDHDEDITYPANPSGLVYAAATAYSRSALRSSDNLDVQNIQMEGVIELDSISDDDIRAGKYDYAAVEIRMVNWQDLSQGSVGEPTVTGWIGQVELKEFQYSAELRGLSQLLTQTLGDLYQPGCRVDLGDPATCKVDLAALTQAGEVTSTADNRTIFASGVSEADGYFDGGLLTWVTGANAGLSMEVKQWTDGSASGEIVLMLKMLLDIQAGDTFTIAPGCDKNVSTCKNKFNNVINFHGEPYVPGRDFLFTYPDYKLPSTG